MAKLGQKHKKYSAETKQSVLDEFILNGLSISYLSKKYKIPEGTIGLWIYKTKNVLVDSRKASSGRRCEVSDIDYKERYEILKKYQAFLQARREKK